MNANSKINIEIAYDNAASQELIALKVSAGTSVAEAIEQAGLSKRFEELGSNNFSCGIFSKKVTLDHQLQDGDRIEIYRDLIIDPKTARRLRAEKQAKS